MSVEEVLKDKAVPIWAAKLAAACCASRRASADVLERLWTLWRESVKASMAANELNDCPAVTALSYASQRAPKRPS